MIRAVTQEMSPVNRQLQMEAEGSLSTTLRRMTTHFQAIKQPEIKDRGAGKW